MTPDAYVADGELQAISWNLMSQWKDGGMCVWAGASDFASVTTDTIGDGSVEVEAWSRSSAQSSNVESLENSASRAPARVPVTIDGV